MGDAGELGRLLEPLYASVLAPERLADFNEAMSGLLGSHVSGTMIQDARTGDVTVHQLFGVDLDFVRRHMATHVINEDPWVSRALSRFRTGAVIDSDTLLPRREMRRTAEYRDYYSRIEIAQQVAAVVGMDEDEIVTLSICRDARRDPFDPRALAVFGHVAAHVGNVVRLQRRLGRLERRLGSLVEALDAVPGALFLLDARARLVQVNAAGEALLSAGTVLRRVEGRLQAHADGGAFEHALQSALAVARGERRPATAPHPLRDVRGTVRCMATLQPLPGAVGAPGCLVGVHALGATAFSGLEATLRALYDLTAAEATLAVAMHRRADLAAAAADCGIAASTARTRLQVVFEKTEAHGQAALARLLATLAANLPTG